MLLERFSLKRSRKRGWDDGRPRGGSASTWSDGCRGTPGRRGRRPGQVGLALPAGERHDGATPDADGRPSRRDGDTAAWLLAAANFGVEHATLRLPVPPPHRAVLLSSTDPDRHGGEVDPDRFVLLPNEVVVLLTPLDARAGASALPPAATW
jgi:hypothetical protein